MQLEGLDISASMESAEAQTMHDVIAPEFFSQRVETTCGHQHTPKTSLRVIVRSCNLQISVIQS